MKKIVGIIVGLIILAVIICGIFFAKNYIVNNGPEPSKEVMTQTYEDYLNKIEASEDEEIYNNILAKELSKKYTLDQTSQMNAYLRGLGKIKNFDKSKIEYSTEEHNNKVFYAVSSKIDFEIEPHIVKIVLGYENGELKIFGFSFSNIVEK